MKHRVSLLRVLILVSVLPSTLFWVGCFGTGPSQDYSEKLSFTNYCLVEGGGDVCYQFAAAVDPAPPNSPPIPSVPYRPFLQRQSDCSLTRFAFDSSGTLLSTYPNYQDYLHKISGLSTTADQFRNGCKDPGTIGIMSQGAVYLGKLPNGNLVGGLLSADGVNVAVINGSTYAIVSTKDYATTGGNTNATPNSIATADLNGDGNLDMVVVTSGFAAPSPGAVSILLGNGDGTFQAPATIPLPTFASSLTIDDLNADGKLDLVVMGASLDPSVPAMDVLLGKGDGTFQSPVAGPTGTTVGAVISADLNGDGKKDLATGSGQILLGNGDGTFTLLAGNAFSASGLAAGDFNNDGKIDLAITNSQAYSVDIYSGKGDGTFTRTSSYASIYGLQNIAVADLDGDGNLDLFVGSESQGIFGEDASTQGFFQSFLGRGDGTFAGAPDYLPQAASQGKGSFDIADLNGDSIPDIVRLDGTNQAQTVSALLGKGDGTFHQGPQTPLSAPGVAIFSADLNGDGHPDAVVARYDGTIAVLLGKGDGTFEAEVDYPGAGNFVQLVLGDVNGDKKPDIALIANPGNTNPATATGLYIMLNNGDGTFQAPKLVDAEQYLNGLAAQDLNGDGRTDIVAITSGYVPTKVAGSAFLYLGNGDGTFQKASALSASGSYFPGAVALSDMNGDGKPDVVIAGTNSDQKAGNIVVLLSNGDGTFQSQITTQTPQTFPNSIAIADLIAGQAPDVLLGACCGLRYPYLMAGKGDGTFSSSNSFSLPLGLSSSGVRFTDLNADGVPDVVMASNNLGVEAFIGETFAAGTATTTALTASATSITVGQSVTFTATVSPSGATGSVSFMDGATTIGTSTLNSAGIATFSSISLSAGAHSITAVYSGDTNFVSSTSSAVTITVSALPPDFTVSPSPSSISISAPGSSGTSTMTVTAQNGFAGTVTLACSVSPTTLADPPTCSLSPVSTSLSASVTSATSALTVATTPASVSMLRGIHFGILAGGANGLLACVFLFNLPERKRRRKLLLMVTLIAILPLVSCGGGGNSAKTSRDPGTAPGSYVVTVTATSGNLSHSITVNVTIQ